MPKDFYVTLHKLKYTLINPEYYDDIEEEDEFRRVPLQEQGPIKVNKADLNTSIIVPDKAQKKRKQYVEKQFSTDPNNQTLSIFNVSDSNIQDVETSVFG